MAVILTSQVEGLQVGEEYSGDREAFLLSEGYAKKTGAPKKLDFNEINHMPEDDPTLADNREAPGEYEVDQYEVEPGREGQTVYEIEAGAPNPDDSSTDKQDAKNEYVGDGPLDDTLASADAQNINPDDSEAAKRGEEAANTEPLSNEPAKPAKK